MLRFKVMLTNETYKIRRYKNSAIKERNSLFATSFRFVHGFDPFTLLKAGEFLKEPFSSYNLFSVGTKMDAIVISVM